MLPALVVQKQAGYKHKREEAQKEIPCLDSSPTCNVEKIFLKNYWPKMLCQSSSSEGGAQQPSAAKENNTGAGLEISQFVHSICYRGLKTTPGNKGLYEITANEVMYKYCNFNIF